MTPSFICVTVLSALELRDCYGIKILNTLSHCDGYTSKLSTTYTLRCKVGGLINSDHDESCDTLGCLSCAKFQHFNVHDETHINLCRDIRENNDVNTLVDPQLGLEYELEEYRGDVLIREHQLHHKCSPL